ncbi:hypothetical protein ABB37_07886 [Leptomonas pyrrhocoris]|uniref:Uncharacterized protein n=1 Tax=Leptomonas pyrrhocoris TaxID=157538 RepID=A0A0N0DSK2_LEPPY|nr:hypothetical protein ABB37_07886 [Leptomonas pyrrhocoris]KPA76114.1 hypothetical protein ABB37_07886 [Leptomonas pyrrhocoris]|eukprot:XP_015654553.1 hypothetical protein ABB37_07886 [Leptomonas pyrrhocoris]
MNTLDAKGSTVALGLNIAYQSSFSPEASLCSAPERLLHRRGCKMTPSSQTEEHKKLNAKITKLEVELDKARKMLYAAEDIIIDERIRLTNVAHIERRSDKMYRVLMISLTLNITAIVGLCVYLDALRRGTSR